MDKIELKIKNTIEKNKLCNKKEKVLVALSGGKDSTLTAYLLKKFGYNIQGLHINLGMSSYSERCMNVVRIRRKPAGVRRFSDCLSSYSLCGIHHGLK